jgi:organic radical activating enzyme
MLIRYKGIEHGITSDAPFIGSRICAIGCSKHCEGCFNQHLLNTPNKEEYTSIILNEVLEHKISQGIILGGLEWTEQPEEMMSLVSTAIAWGLQVMIYTHHSIDEFLDMFPSLRGHDIYVKCGEYRQNEKGYLDEINDVRLASGNQKIYNLKNY